MSSICILRCKNWDFLIIPILVLFIIRVLQTLLSHSNRAMDWRKLDFLESIRGQLLILFMDVQAVVVVLLAIRIVRLAGRPAAGALVLEGNNLDLSLIRIIAEEQQIDLH